MLVNYIEQILSLGFLVKSEGMCWVVKKDHSRWENPHSIATNNITASLTLTADFINSRLNIKFIREISYINLRNVYEINFILPPEFILEKYFYIYSLLQTLPLNKSNIYVFNV